MPHYDQPFNFFGQQGSLFAWLTTGTDTLLDTQAEMLSGFKTTMSEWMDRRQAAVRDMKQLLARLQSNNDPETLLHIQQQWFERSLERMAADAAGFYQALLLVGQTARRVGEHQSAAAEPAGNVTAARFAGNGSPRSGRRS